MSLGTLASPAPFVYGGTFSDYVKERRKFTRFSTLATFSKVISRTSSEVSTHSEAGDDIQKLYAEARAQDVGTVDAVELPECTMKTVNLVDIARFIQESRGETIGHQEEQDLEEEWENDEEEEEDEQEEYSIDVERYEQQIEILSDDEMRALIAKADADLLMPSFMDSTIEVDSTMDDKQCMIVDSCFPDGCVPCQLVALATPPSSTSDPSMYMAFSDATVKTAVASTMAGAKAAAKMAVAELEPELDHTENTLFSHDEVEQVEAKASEFDVADSVLHSRTSKSTASLHRFKFASYDLEVIAAGKHAFAPSRKDDGSNWVVDNSRLGESYACLPRKRRSQGSASSWGGGGAFLEPIASGKVSLEKAVSVTLPKLPSGPPSADELRSLGAAESMRFGPLPRSSAIF